MKLSSVLAAGLISAAIAGVGGVANAQYAAPPSANYQNQSQPPAAQLTPELHRMWMIQHRSELQGMSPDQRQAYRQQLRQQFMTMGPAQKAQLQAQWAALPPQRQQAIEQRMTMRRQGGAPGGNQYGPQGARPNPGYQGAPPQGNGGPPGADEGPGGE